MKKRIEKQPQEQRSQARSADEVIKVAYDPINESVVLAAAMVASTEERRSLVRRYTSDYFQDEKHQKIWAALQALDQRSLEFDIATIDQLSGGGVDVNYMTRLIEARPVVPANLAHHCKELEWDRTRMDAIKGPIGSFLEDLRESSTDPNQLRAKAVAVAKAFDSVESGLLRDSNAMMEEQLAKIRARTGGIGCYSYGLEGFDKFDDGSHRVIPGAAPGECTIITAISGSGKTTTLANMVNGMIDMKRRVLFGAWEQGDDMLELIASIRAGVDLSKSRIGLIDEATVDRIKQAMTEVLRFVRFIGIPRIKGAKYPRDYNERVVAALEREISETKCDVFIADLYRRAFKKMEPDEEEQVLFETQDMIQRQKVHAMLAHQQRLKDVEQRANKMPTREGLKGSGAWVEMADTILAPHRPSLWNPNLPDDVLQVMILKQRRGKWPIAVEFDFAPSKGKISRGRDLKYNPSGGSDLDDFLEREDDSKKSFGGGRGRKR